MSDAQRNLPPTRRRIRQARREGRVPRSRDLGAAASWLVVWTALWLVLPAAADALGGFATGALGDAPRLASLSPAQWTITAAEVLARVCAVPLLACFAAVLLTGMLFSGPTFSVQAVTPRLDRLSPVAGLKRVLEPARWFESLRDLVKLVVVLALAALAARSTVSLLAAAPAQPASHGGLIVREVVLQVVVLVGAGAAAFALLDVAWSRYRWLQGLRMTPSELKRELRETEGDPEIKGQRRRLHREVSEHRMLEQVRSATVVVVNPTHVAVALRWDEQEMDAPTVAASGRDSMARRIIEEARRANIPVVHDAPLARTLADLQPGEMIPEKLYEAVAGIIRVIQEQP